MFTAAPSQLVTTWKQPTYPSVREREIKSDVAYSYECGIIFQRYELNLRLIQTDHNVEPKTVGCRTIHTMVPFMKTEKHRTVLHLVHGFIRTQKQRAGKEPHEKSW